MDFFSSDENGMRDDTFLRMIHPYGFLLYINYGKLKPIVYIMVSYLQILNAWSTYYLVNNFHLFLQYNSLLLAQQFGLTCALYFAMEYRQLIRFEDRMKDLSWPLDFCGEECRALAVERMRSLRRVFLLIMLGTAGGHALFLPFVGDERDIFVEIEVIEAAFHEGVVRGVSSASFYGVIVFLGFSVATTVEHFVYVSVHLEIQFRMLNWQVEHIGCGSEFLDGIDDDGGVQDLIGSRLKFCIARHISLLELFHSLPIQNNWHVLMFSSTGVLMIVSEMYLVLAGVSSKSNIRLVIATFCSVYVGYLLLIHGQQLKDEYMKLHAVAQNCSWLGWNRQNINYLRMLLMNSSEPIRITSYNLVDLDYTLIVKLIKIVYSVLTALLNLSR